MHIYQYLYVLLDELPFLRHIRNILRRISYHGQKLSTAMMVAFTYNMFKMSEAYLMTAL